MTSRYAEIGDYCACGQHFDDHDDELHNVRKDALLDRLERELQTMKDDAPMDKIDQHINAEDVDGDSMAECAYCGLWVENGEVPSHYDDDAWADLAEQHRDDCEWIHTRAHRRDVPADGAPRASS